MTIVGPSVTGFSHGVANDETGLNIQAHSVTSANEFIDPLMNKAGERRAEARGAVFSTVNISGQVNGTTGVNAFDFFTACTLANSPASGAGSTVFGQTAGVFLMTEAVVSQSFDGWKTLSQTFTRHAGITS